MGNQNSDFPSRPPVLRSQSTYDAVRATPRLSLMRLKKGKTTELPSEQRHRNAWSPRSRTGVALSTRTDAVPLTLIHSQTISEIVPTKPQASFSRVRAVVSDIQCDDMDCDDESIQSRPCGPEDGEELVTAPFAVEFRKTGEDAGDSSFERKTDIEDDRKSKLDKFEIRTIKSTPETTSRWRSKVNLNSEPYKRRVSEAKKMLMEAATDGNSCFACHRPLIGGNFVRAPCGHCFHSECIEDRPRCPQCGEVIEKGFTI